MAVHASFSPSSAATWLNCSYSARNAPAIELPKKASTKEASDEGTRVHDALLVWHMFGELPPRGVVEYRSVALWADMVRKIEAEGARTYAEHRVQLNDDCWGTADLIGDHPHIVTIADYKNGKWDVFAHKNAQMLTYAIMLLAMTRAQWFRFIIFQPNGLDAETGEDGFKQWVAHRSEVEAHYQRVLAALADQSGPRPGPWCRWCKAFQLCPAMSNDANFVMGAISRPIESLTTDELVRLLRLIRALGDVKEVYEDALTTHLKMGRTSQLGATLKPERTYRAWNDAQQAAQALWSNFGAKGVKPVTPAQAEKLGPAGKAYVAIGSHKPEAGLKASY